MADQAVAPWFERLGGRKYSLTFAGLFFGFILALLGKLTAEFTAVIIATAGFFNGANMGVTMSATKAQAAVDVARAANPTKEDA